MALRRRKPIEAPVDPGPRRVLVVNDEPGACELLVRLVQRAGYQVSRAHDFLEMATRLLEDRPHAVVLDVTAGGIGGNLKLLDDVRGHAEPDIAGARVVLCATSQSNAMFSWQAGIDSFLLRPFHADELTAELAAVLEREEEERPRHRRRALGAAKSGGRRLPTPTSNPTIDA
jgi:DNA-binding response OmpR family regulator